MEKKKPAKKFSLGSVSAAVWENQGENGAFYSVTLSRTYKVGDAFKESSSFGPRELPSAIALGELALGWILGETEKTDQKEAA